MESKGLQTRSTCKSCGRAPALKGRLKRQADSTIYWRTCKNSGDIAQPHEKLLVERKAAWRGRSAPKLHYAVCNQRHEPASHDMGHSPLLAHPIRQTHMHTCRDAVRELDRQNSSQADQQKRVTCRYVQSAPPWHSLAGPQPLPQLPQPRRRQLAAVGVQEVPCHHRLVGAPGKRGVVQVRLAGLVGLVGFVGVAGVCWLRCKRGRWCRGVEERVRRRRGRRGRGGG